MITMLAATQRRWLESISIGRARSAVDPEELHRLDPLEGVVRTGVDAGGLVVLATEVAGGGLLADLGLHHARVLGILGDDLERVQVDVAVGALGGAEPAADAPVLDDDLERVGMK